MKRRSFVSFLCHVRSDLSESLLLSNLRRSTDLLQRTSLFLRLSKELEHDLPGIDVFEEEESKRIRGAIRSEAMEVLERGMVGLNQAEVGTGLQVFYDLGELKATVAQLVNKYEGMGVKSINAALDTKAMSTPGGSGYGLGTIGGGWDRGGALWKRIEECVEKLHSVVVAVWHLQRVLSQTRDPVTHVSLLDDVVQDGDAMLSDRVWEALVPAFASQLQSAFTGSISVNAIFTADYPKMLSMVENLLERISRDTDVEGVLPAITPEVKHRMVSAIEIFEIQYLRQCSRRLIFIAEYVLGVSTQGSLPSKLHFLRTVSCIQEEIEKAVQLDRRLTLLVLHEIGMALRQLAKQAENQLSTGPEARQVMGPATAAQLKNFTTCQHLQEIHGRISSTIQEFPLVAADELSPALGAIYEVACDAMTSLFQSVLDRLQSCILQIHDQNFGVLGMDAAMDNNVSPYMEELQKCILHFRTEFLVRMLTPATTRTGGTEMICTRLVRNMASRVLIFFIRHAALVRPLSESGRRRLARDMAELELSVSRNLFKVEQLGAPYRALRAFRPLIFLKTSQLGASPLLQDLPVSVILHHLYTHGPDDLQSPMQRNKLTLLQYSSWMDSQGEDQIWKGVKATLDDYAAKVRLTRGDEEFSPVYPLMLRVGSSLTKNASVAR